MLEDKETLYVESYFLKSLTKKIFERWPKLRKPYMAGEVGFSITYSRGGAKVEPKAKGAGEKSDGKFWFHEFLWADPIDFDR